MKFAKNKTMAALIALILMLTMTGTLVVLPIATAHTPSWNIPTWTYVSISPNPVGVNQSVIVAFWSDKVMPTSNGPYGDRWTFTVEVTKPDGTKQTLGPTTSDPIGGGYFEYTPNQVGTYYFQAFFPDQILKGANPNPVRGAQENSANINDTYQASNSTIEALIVQQEPLTTFPAAPLPTDYWTRPIYASNREWSQIAGNWLGGNDPTSISMFQPYSTAPSTAHIVWTKPIAFGGIVGGSSSPLSQFDDGSSTLSYYTGSSYEIKWAPPVLMQGRLYYNVQQQPRYGWYCVDLRTGEEIFYQNSTGPMQIDPNAAQIYLQGYYPGLSFGQLYDYESPNQGGPLAYLWSTCILPTATSYTYLLPNSTSYTFTAASRSNLWQMYDAFTGNWIGNIANVPSGSSANGQDGSLLIYTYNSAGGWLTLWNSSKALLPFPDLAFGGNNAWKWRPELGATVDGKFGYSWNVTVPKNLGSIRSVLSDRILGTSGNTATGPYSVWALNLKQGQKGELIWKKDYNEPPVANTTVNIGPVDETSGIFTMAIKETMQLYGYNLDTGEKVWGPTASQPAFDMYSFPGRPAVAYGKLFTISFAGIVFAYDFKTGALLWNASTNLCGLEGPYTNWPAGQNSGITVADGKVYVTTGEHSSQQPLYRGWSVYCFDQETGKSLWNFTGYMERFAIADGYMVSFDIMDQQIYCFGKGQTATTVTAPDTVQPLGSSVVLRGYVTDQSAGAKGTPAISDDDMTGWMEYLYHQKSKLNNAKGVEVSLDTIDPNNNYVHIGNTTSDSDGLYSYVFTPDVPGKYTIIATFAGSNSYFASHAETAMAVSEPVATASPYPETVLPPTEMYIVGGVVAIIIAIAIVGALIMLMLRKRP